MAALKSLPEVIDDAKKAISLGYRVEAAAILAHFSECNGVVAPEQIHSGLIYKDIVQMLDKLFVIDGYPELQRKVINSNLPMLYQEMLTPASVFDPPLPPPTAAEDELPAQPGRLQRKSDPDSSDFDKQDEDMRQVNANHILPNTGGSVCLSEDFYTSLREDHGITVNKFIKYEDDEYKVTRAFTNLEARDKYHQSKDYHYEPGKIWTRDAGTTKECMKAPFFCRFRAEAVDQKNSNGRKNCFCPSVVIEHRYTKLGITILYEGSRSQHKHAAGLLSRGLPREDKRMIRKLVKEAQGFKDVSSALSGARGTENCNATIEERHRQIQEYFTKVGGSSGSHESGVKLDKLLCDLRVGVQAKIKERVFMESIKYPGGAEVPGILYSCDSWIEHLNNKIWFLDATWVKHSNHKNTKIIALKSIDADGRIKPIAFCTAHEECILTIQTFLDYLLTEIAPKAGIEVPTGVDGKCQFNLPDLMYFLADGIAGMDSLVQRLFGSAVVRISCYFHVVKALKKWLKKLGFSVEVQGYMLTVMRELSVCENVPSFFAKWSLYRGTIEAKVKDEAATWAKAKEIITHVEKQLIHDEDNNRWARALIGDQYAELHKLVRTTVSESFMSSLKRELKKYGDTISRSHLELRLTEVVFPVIHANYSVEKTRSISPSKWNYAQLLVELIKKRYEGQAFPTPSEKYTFHYNSGKIYACISKSDPPTIQWTYVGVSEDSSNITPRVVFGNMTDFVLQSLGFCIITGSMKNGVMPRDWYKKAKCTCLEFLESGYMPCVHILVIYLLVCTQQEFAEVKKLICEGRNIQKFFNDHIRAELKKSDDCYKYPNCSGRGYEFVHSMCLVEAQQRDQKAKTLDNSHAENLLGQRAAANTMTLLDRATEDADKYMKQSQDKSNFILGDVYCVSTTRLLQSMPSDRFRKLVSMRNTGRFCIMDKLPPLPGNMVFQSTRKVQCKRVFVSVFGSQESGPSLLKRAKAHEKRTGGNVAREDIQNATADKYLTVNNLGKGKRKGNN